MRCPLRDADHRARHVHVLCEIEVVGTCSTGGLGDSHVAIIRQARNHRVDRLRGKVVGQSCGIARVQGDAGQVRAGVCADNSERGFAIDVAEENGVTI